MGGADQTTHGRTMQYRTKGKSGRNLLVLILGRAILNLFSFNVPAWLSTGNISQIQ